MKKSIAFLVGSVVLGVGLIGCGNAKVEVTAQPKSACCAEPVEKSTEATAALPDQSLYNVSSTWTNDAGKTLKLDSLRGKPQVICMFFAQCVSACPILVNDLRRIEEALPEGARGKVGFLLVSFDTQRDTPEALAKYRKARSLPENWTMLTAGPDDVLELAALLGVKFKKEASGQFAHSNLITIVDPNGEVITQQVGLNRDPAPAVAALNPYLQVR